ncbi:hypothetical protein GCM10010166_32840 [Couchioplanes caeruleus subsp. azureus]|nr:hypothetical protein GCM10010166_32840 [Couchioplanes caeruleus subsp. azureus]
MLARHPERDGGHVAVEVVDVCGHRQTVASASDRKGAEFYSHPPHIRFSIFFCLPDIRGDDGSDTMGGRSVTEPAAA